MSTAGNDHLNNNDFDSIIFSIKDRKLYVPVVTFQQQTIKNYQNVLAKDVYWNEYEIKCETKNMTNEFRYFPKSNLLESINYLF